VDACGLESDVCATLGTSSQNVYGKVANCTYEEGFWLMYVAFASVELEPQKCFLDEIVRLISSASAVP
jgi:hypothetical protein